MSLRKLCTRTETGSQLRPHFISLRELIQRLGFTVAPIARAEAVRNYVYVGRDREKLAEPGFLDHRGVDRFQVKYSWKQLEQGKDHYVFEDIRADLALLKSKGKGLFIQIQDSNFVLEFVPVPKYLLEDPGYHSAVAYQRGERDGKPYGYVARRWDPAVRQRFIKLLFALGKEFDGKVEGINLRNFDRCAFLLPKRAERLHAAGLPRRADRHDDKRSVSRM